MIQNVSSNRPMSGAVRRWLPFTAALLLLIAAIAMLIWMVGPALQARGAAPVSAFDAGSARWAELGRYYSSLQRSVDASSARWHAVGRSYTRLERSIDASSARWQALGESFLGADADVAPRMRNARR